LDVKGKVAIVTGASSGIGLETARLLSKKGAKLALVARSKEELEHLTKELPDSIAIIADLSMVQEIENTIALVYQHFGRIDILVNNAGRGYDAQIEKIDPEVVHSIFDLDLLGPVVAMQQVIPIMRKQGGGSIINISSGLALMFLPGMSIYSSLKRALAHLSMTAREELKGNNVTVSVMYPYITTTDFDKNTIKALVDESEPQEEGEYEGAPFEPDTAEYVARKIVEGIESGEAEIFAHDWMKKMPA
jgi:short-subunit dehydrogenase